MTNRLAAESSPYLLQHAENPVAWYPWGEDGVCARAHGGSGRSFFSIGYSTCHWCPREWSASRSRTRPSRELLNQNFIAIKVDREERPDVDRVYMAFVPGNDRRRRVAHECPG